MTGGHPSFISDGFEAVPGFATTVAVTGSEMIRKSTPYTNCTDQNLEALRLLKSTEQKLNFTYNGRIEEGNYDTSTCFSTCLQRKIYTTFGCFDILEAYAYHEVGRFCGKTDYIMERLISGYTAPCLLGFKQPLSLCMAPYQTMISDLECIKNVKDVFENEKDTYCACPPPCHVINYDLSMGLAKWPSRDPNLGTAYSKLINDNSHGLIAQFE